MQRDGNVIKYVLPEISLSSLIIRKNKNVFEIKIHGEIYNIYKFRLIELSSIKSFLLLGINFVVGRFELFFLVQLLSQLVKVLFKKHPSDCFSFFCASMMATRLCFFCAAVRGKIPERDSSWKGFILNRVVPEKDNSWKG